LSHQYSRIRIVEENLPSYEERIQVHSEIRSVEAIDIRESSSEEIQMVIVNSIIFVIFYLFGYIYNTLKQFLKIFKQMLNPKKNISF
jgi:hypothetical protein